MMIAQFSRLVQEDMTIVDLLEVLVSYPMLATLVVRRVIVNEYPLRRQQTLLAGEGQQGSQIGSVS